jgi:hypothetical protein
MIDSMILPEDDHIRPGMPSPPRVHTVEPEGLVTAWIDYIGLTVFREELILSQSDILSETLDRNAGMSGCG